MNTSDSGHRASGTEERTTVSRRRRRTRVGRVLTERQLLSCAMYQCTSIHRVCERQVCEGRQSGTVGAQCVRMSNGPASIHAQQHRSRDQLCKHYVARWSHGHRGTVTRCEPSIAVAQATLWRTALTTNRYIHTSILPFPTRFFVQLRCGRCRATAGPLERSAAAKAGPVARCTIASWYAMDVAGRRVSAELAALSHAGYGRVETLRAVYEHGV